MNKRIKKKKEQQRLAWTIRELVTEAQREEAQKQALIRRFVDAYDNGNRPFPACHLENKTLKEVVHLSKP